MIGFALRRRFVIALAAVAASAAPTPAQSRDTTIRNAGAPRHAGMATLVQELSIGTVNGPEAYALGNITEVAIGRGGTIYALDRQLYAVRVYDATGRHLRNVGRRGDGPGEFSSPAGIGVLPDGRLLVWDTRHWRMTVFDTAGNLSTTWPVQTTGAVGGASGVVVDTAGFAYGRRLTTQNLAQQTPGMLRTTVTWFKFRVADGRLVDSIVEPDLPPYAPGLRARNTREILQMAVPFAPRRLATMTPHGTVVSTMAERYAFEMRAPGRSVVSVRRAVQPEVIPSRARDSARAYVEGRMRDIDAGWSWPSTSELPRAMPMFVEVFAGLDGRIWLQRDKSQPPMVSAPLQPGRAGASAAVVADPRVDFVYKPTHFDVFEPSGDFVGQVEMPAKVTPMAMRGDTVWAVAKDDDDVQYLRRYRILWR